jgi:hypothetical protein
MSKISEVFNKDPLAWTAEDRDLAVAYYKANRDKFVKLKTIKTKKAQRKAIAQLELELGEAEERMER